MMNEAKFQEVFSDEVFVTNLLTMETPEEVQLALQKKDLDLSVEEIVQIKDMLAQKLNDGDELSDADLENVAGGIAITTIAAVGSLIIGAVCGVGGLVGGTAMYANQQTRGAW